MERVIHLLFLSFCFGFIVLVLQSEPSRAKQVKPGDLDPKLGTVLQKLDAVSCAASGYVDNADGTLCDCTRNLMWEKKTGTLGEPAECTGASPDSTCFDPHDVNNGYQWSSTGSDPDGALFTVFLAQLNGEIGGMGCFAGHCDWRIPELDELFTIFDLSKGFCGVGIGPCINAIFGPTAASDYWSSTEGDHPQSVKGVNFSNGVVTNFANNIFLFTRAVRDCE